MDVEITCPVCNFSKAVPMDTIPEGVKWVICPGCKHGFEMVSNEPDIEKDESSPWERRMELSLWQAIYKTFIAVLFSPGRFFRKMISGKGIGEALAFGLLTGSLGYMIGLFWEFLLVSIGKTSSGGFFSRIPVTWFFLAAMILSPLIVLMRMYITSAVIHGLMRVFNDGRGGFEGTFKVIAFGQSTRALTFIPFIGGIAGWFWNLVVVIIGLKEIHKTSYSKAISSVVIILILEAVLILPVFLLKGIFKMISVLQ